MADYVSERGSHHQDSECQTDTNCRRRFWRKAEEVLLAELYTDFVPRWFKKQDIEPSKYETKAAVAWLSPALKFGIAVGFCPILTAFNFGDYEPIIGGLSVYLAADAIYQLIDLTHPYYKDLRRAATLAVDLLTYPYYLISSKTHHGYSSK